MPVKAIDTDPLPNFVEYVEELDEIWVLCWGNSTLNVIGVKNVTTQISKIKDMSSLVVKHSIRAQVRSLLIKYTYVLCKIELSVIQEFA